MKNRGDQAWLRALVRAHGALFATACTLFGLLCGVGTYFLLSNLVGFTKNLSSTQNNPIAVLLFILAVLIAAICPPVMLLIARYESRRREIAALRVEPSIEFGNSPTDVQRSDVKPEDIDFDFRSLLPEAKKAAAPRTRPLLGRLAGLALILGVIAGALGAGVHYWDAKAQNEPEFSDWQAAVRESSRDGYDAFLRLWPNSRFAPEAARRLRLLDQSSDEAAWKAVIGNATKEAYESYLKQFPNGLHAAAAASALREIASSQPLSSSAERQLKASDDFRECVNCPSMVVVPSGDFLMGSLSAEIEQYKAFKNESPQHKVVITRPFAIAKYEVTFAEWDACVAAGGCRGYRAGDEGWGRGSRPVMNVSWDDAKLYARWLSQKTGKTYRLPTEAEWEYAARAGSSSRFSFGNDSKSLCKFANVADEAGSRNLIGPRGFSTWQLCNDGYANTAPVGSFAPNRFGLYDMLGNVNEWVEDIWHDNYDGAPTDGSAWLSGGDAQVRIARGGSFFNLEDGVRSAVRYNIRAGSQGNLVGFRIARTLAE